MHESKRQRSGPGQTGESFELDALSFELVQRALAPHPDFQVQVGGWYVNENLRNFVPGSSELKVRFLFNQQDGVLLDNCPFATKIGRNTKGTGDYEWVGFAYATEENPIEQVEEWAKRFSKAEVFTYGTPTEHGWGPGTFLRRVT